MTRSHAQTPMPHDTTCSHVWIDPDDAPIARAPVAPIIDAAPHQMKEGHTYQCQRCGATLIARGGPESLVATPTLPRVLNKKTATAAELAQAVYVGRPSNWGNPFRIGQRYQGRILTRADVIEAHRDWLLHSDAGRRLLADVHELRGRHLVCWCAPHACHADLLLQLANAL